MYNDKKSLRTTLFQDPEYPNLSFKILNEMYNVFFKRFTENIETLKSINLDNINAQFLVFKKKERERL